MFEHYFGLIEAVFVFGLAIAFYIWQKRDLARYDDHKPEKPPEDGADGKG